jgi:hypothetical protein
MRKLLYFIFFFLILISVNYSVFALDSAYFGSGNVNNQTFSPSTQFIIPVTNYVGNHVYLKTGNNSLEYSYNSNYNGYYNDYQIYNNSFSSYIFSKSLCEPAVVSTLKGKSISVNNNNTRFYLSNGQVWKQYIFFGGQLIESTTSAYKYTPSSSPDLKVRIFRPPNSYECRLMLDDIDTGIFVYREN